ncbi:hypothetical protein H0I68_21730 [Yersinia kristensenii]|uniref:hypothetical protein n=1 Tax=Yersinia kristensenii TaxID=28152 RepID=UPI001C60B79B|nr:hypothetical protein [Yersinia kristensenii]MBW5827646.1 hypothetical protein [Yersinia kristensenii]
MVKSSPEKSHSIDPVILGKPIDKSELEKMEYGINKSFVFKNIIALMGCFVVFSISESEVFISNDSVGICNYFLSHGTAQILSE